jgi:hypothetical protein
MVRVRSSSLYGVRFGDAKSVKSNLEMTEDSAVRWANSGFRQATKGLLFVAEN